MTLFERAAFCLAVTAMLFLGPGLARAQTVTATQQPYPERFVNGQDVGQSTRPVNLNPFGVNYADCVADMVLQFNLTLDGFTGSQNMQIWATATGDCTATTTRGIGSIPTCWQLEGSITLPVIGIATTRSFNVRVQDLVGPENTPPNPPVVVNEGAAACNAQTTFAAVPITVWFLPLDLQGNSIGTPFSQTISTDLVGPPPPVGVGESVGDTLFNVTWTPNTDADTTGYDVFMDPPPGSQPTDAASVTDATFTLTPVLYCPDSGTTSITSTTSTSDAGDAGDATTTVTTTASVDAGCFYVNVGPTSTPGSVSNAGTCTSANLSGGFSVDSGVVENEAGIVSAGGGISTISCAYVIGVGSNCYSAGGETVTGESTTQYTIEGLTNGTTYDVVVAAVDGSGNVGPPSSCVHDFPAPVNDFFATYRNDGGRAGGSFCALDAVGLRVGSAGLFGGLGAGILAVLRRRRRVR
jgi:hypothetical protein